MSVGGLDMELLYVIIPTLFHYFCSSVPHNCIMLSLHLVTFFVVFLLLVDHFCLQESFLSYNA